MLFLFFILFIFLISTFLIFFLYTYFPVDEDPDDVVQGAEKKPSGKVVGIIKRNWKPYPFVVSSKEKTLKRNEI